MDHHKIFKLTEKLGDRWFEYCEVEEELRDTLKESLIPDEEKVLKEITIHIKILTFNKNEEIREMNEEKWFGGNRGLKLNMKDVEEAIAYLRDLKRKYKGGPNATVQAIIAAENKEVANDIKKSTFRKGKGIRCLCNDESCGKCLGNNCMDTNCPTHTKKNKIAWRQRWAGNNKKEFPHPKNW